VALASLIRGLTFFLPVKLLELMRAQFKVRLEIVDTRSIVLLIIATIVIEKAPLFLQFQMHIQV
jgi:hypothetical protein